MEFKLFLLVSIAALFAAHSAWCAVTEPSERYSLPISMNGHNAYGGSSGAIPLSALVPPTLNQLYGPNSQILLSLDFAQQPYRWDPYNTYNQSEFHWRFAGDPTLIQADNAYIELSSSAGPYGNSYRSAALLSAPFQRWQPLATVNATNVNSTEPTVYNPYNEGVLTWNSSAVINPTQRVLLRFVLKCKIFRAQYHPFPAYLVSYPNDDPRFANCYVSLIPEDANVTSGIYVIVTNKSIWAVYYTKTTLSKRRIGIRQSYDELVDVALQYNAPTNEYTFFVSGQATLVITQAGLPLPPDANTKTDPFGVGTPAAQSQGSEFSVNFGTHKCLDESDPWNQTDTTQLVRLFSDPTYYGPTAMFYDNENMRSNNLWDQTVKMTLISVVVETASGAVPSTPPSTAYGINNNNNNNNIAYAPNNNVIYVPAYMSSNSGDN